MKKIPKKHISRLVLGFCIALNIVAFIPLSFAQITIDGLSAYPELKSYIDKVVIERYEAEQEQGLRTSKIRSDISKALKSKGYYDARVVTDDAQDGVFVVKPGKQYTISSISFEGVAYNEALQMNVGDVIDANSVLIEQARIFTSLSNDRCIYNLNVKNKVILNADNTSAELIFVIEGEDDALFGEVSFEGAENIDRDYLRHFIKFEAGECWNASKLEKTKTALISTGLLSNADYELPATLPKSGIVPVHFALKERAPRTVRLGAKYSTSEGPGVSAEWKHRNIFGEGEEFSVKSQISQLVQSIEAEFEKPFFLSDKNKLGANALIERSETDAYEELKLDLGADIRRQLSDHWSGKLGVALEASEIKEQSGETKNYGLVSYPGELSFDNRDSVLDPHKGLNFGFTAEPFYDTFGEAKPFFKTEVTAATYFDLSDSSFDPVLALRGSWGSISGTNTEDIPASKRFYAGGGGSIRGFGFQEAGPKDDNNDPRGGRSLLETSAEMRVKFTDTIGAVGFVDAGGVFDSAYPDFDEGLYVGAGIGARYYTSFGPIRFDVAVPVNKREESDAPFQIYISIGQAF